MLVVEVFDMFANILDYDRSFVLPMIGVSL